MLDSVHDIRQRLLIAKLPAMPEILVKLIRLCQTEEAGMAELAELIAKDPAMASKILSAANSSLYAGRTNKPGLMHSLQTLGMNTTKTLLICESVFQVFNDLPNAKATDLRGFWRHSLIAAIGARKIAERIAYPHLEEAYLAGLLHDIGRLALFSAAPKEYLPLASHIDDASLCLAEERLLHITHTEAGALLIERWGLDAYLADSVLYHHQPISRAVSTHPLIRTVILADALACLGMDQATLNIAQVLCGIEAAALTTICDEATEQVQQTAEMLRIDLADSEPAFTLISPAAPAIAPDSSGQLLIEEVRQLALNSTASRFYSQAPGVAGVWSAVAQSAAMLFGFKEVLLLQRDNAANCLRGVAADSSRPDRAEFMMPLDDGGAVSVAMAQERAVFIEPDTQLPKLSEEQQLLLEICNGKVKPNLKPESADQAERNTANQTLSLAEEQLLRLLDAEYLVCLPLLHNRQCLGVVIGAALALQVGELQLREAFLMAFASQAAAAIDSASRKEKEELHIGARIAAEYRQASRQAVHEANNPLSIIKNYLAVLDGKAARQESVAAEIAILGSEIDRVGQILRGLAEIQPAPSEGPIDLDRVVGEAVKFYSASLPPAARVRVSTRLQAEATKLKADADTLKQILLNLIKNAAEAIPESGEIVVATGAAINRDGRLYCSLSVQDNGPGIAPEVLAKLFSPIATTKTGQHMGLGLSIVHGLVRQLGGTIACRSSRDGTCFEILLPVCLSAADDPSQFRSAH
ncbi:MAG: HDOD domain-containing protein [Sterolibacterium sp.]